MTTPRTEHEARFCTSLADGLGMAVANYQQLLQLIHDDPADDDLQALEFLAVGIGIPLIAHVRAFEMTGGEWELHQPPLDAIHAARVLGETYAICMLILMGEDPDDAPVPDGEAIDALLTPALIRWMERWSDDVPAGV